MANGECAQISLISTSEDDFPLLRIDKVVDTAVGCETMAQLDWFSRYHQIWIRKEDEEKTSFITSFDTYCYLRMPEGLKMMALHSIG
jgi:hypothetical protein